MKKRVLSVFLSFVMCLSLLPMNVFAEGDSVGDTGTDTLPGVAAGEIPGEDPGAEPGAPTSTSPTMLPRTVS